MMKIISSCGTLLQVTEVQPLCEEVVSFNGRDIVMTARAKDLSVRPTAMALAIVREDSNSFGAEIIIGNLQPDKVIEILNALGKDEFYDFSQFTYQAYEGKMLDGGKSGPYTCRMEKRMCGAGFCHENHYEDPVPIPLLSNPNPWDQEADSEHLSWDDARKMNYQENESI